MKGPLQQLRPAHFRHIPVRVASACTHAYEGCLTTLSLKLGLKLDCRHVAYVDESRRRLLDEGGAGVDDLIYQAWRMRADGCGCYVHLLERERNRVDTCKV